MPEEQKEYIREIEGRIAQLMETLKTSRRGCIIRLKIEEYEKELKRLKSS